MKKLLLFNLVFFVAYSSFTQNIGIGTTAPEGLLHLKGTNWTKAILENNTGEARGYIGADNNGTVTIGANAYWNGSTWVYPNGGASMYLLMHRLNNRYEFRVRPDAGNQATAMTIDTGSNVSIGGNLVIDQENGNAGTINTNSLRFGNLSGEGIGSKRNAGAGQYGLDFYTGNTNRVTITNTGNVGINVVNPSSKLELRGALGFSSTTKKWEMNYDSTNQYFYIDEFGTARRLTIKDGGNIGINTTNPQTTLDVNGDVNIENRLLLNNSTGNNGQVLVSNGSGSAPTWENMAYGNNDRFFYTTSGENYIRNTDTIYYTTVSSGSSAVSYNNGIFTINKSGLYRIEGALNPLCNVVSSSSTIYYRPMVVFLNSSDGFTLWSNTMNNHTTNWYAHVPFNQTLYMTAGRQFYILPFFIEFGSSGMPMKRHFFSSPLSIYLISE